ncbi:MAG: hypothetical protein WBB74_10785 [Gaiellaceae bacterium]
MARNPERDFGEARERIDRGDDRGALKALDRARAGFAGRDDVEGLEHVLDLEALIGDGDERIEAARANLVYATKQNLRGVTRKAALRAGRPWVDPYPDLEAPVEHTRIPVTRGVKFWIGVGVVVGVLGIAAYVAVAIIVGLGSTKELPVLVTNNLSQTVDVRWCDDESCDFPNESHELHPGGTAEFDLPRDDLLDLLVVRNSSSKHRLGCLPLAVKEATRTGRFETWRLSVSRMTPCPGVPISS